MNLKVRSTKELYISCHVARLTIANATTASKSCKGEGRQSAKVNGINSNCGRTTVVVGTESLDQATHKVSRDVASNDAKVARC
jgi:hypothetical protein